MAGRPKQGLFENRREFEARRRTYDALAAPGSKGQGWFENGREYRARLSRERAAFDKAVEKAVKRQLE